MAIKMRIRTLFSKWYIFVAWVALSVILWHWATYMITRPTAQEKMAVFICSESCDQETLVQNLQSVRPEYVVQMDFKWVSPTDEMFSIYYDAFAVDGSDLIVMPESKLNEYSYVDYFKLDVDLVEQTYNRSFEFYRADDGDAYGVKINAENCLGLQASSSELQTYYLFFNKNSLHLGDWNDSPRAGAIILAQVFL